LRAVGDRPCGFRRAERFSGGYWIGLLERGLLVAHARRLIALAKEGARDPPGGQQARARGDMDTDGARK
jgi:hypothetical protein